MVIAHIIETKDKMKAWLLYHQLVHDETRREVRYCGRTMINAQKTRFVD